MTADLIDGYLHIEPESRLDRVRSLRAEARANIQETFDALFVNGTDNGFSQLDRFAIGYFVARLQQSEALAATFAAPIREQRPELLEALDREIEAGRATGPFGGYKEPRLQTENTPGNVHRTSPDFRQSHGAFLAAGLDHAHLLVFRPREASPEALQALVNADWLRSQVITLSQQLGYLSFLVRVLHGLTVLQDVVEGEAAA